ncbi:hypothetical protein [Nostoc sp. NZL]|uniref:hypothetical protein n=1 Tax=Nostoc sp. NZL TaxID=2650612 RepID=UPI0018C671BA|nr:hypothetical protein [Nostoc sp. NZL]
MTRSLVICSITTQKQAKRIELRIMLTEEAEGQGAGGAIESPEAERNMGIKPRLSKTFLIARSLSFRPILPPAPCSPASFGRFLIPDHRMSEG